MSYFVFRRDLRLIDNTALNLAFGAGPVTALFVFDPVQVGDSNSYRSFPAIRFMVESLLELQAEIQRQGGQLFTLHCTQEQLLQALAQEQRPVYENLDYTPFARRRADAFRQRLGTRYRACDDYVIANHDSIKSKSGQYYRVFKYYYQQVLTILHGKDWLPETVTGSWGSTLSPALAQYQVTLSLPPPTNTPIRSGGRSRVLPLLSSMKQFDNYAVTREFPQYDTTVLSPYLKFGNISIREAVKATVDQLGVNHELVRQLIWHDFYAYIMYHAPEQQTIGGGNLRQLSLKWEHDAQLFERWATGRTGVPLVDAGMRQLLAVGWMHNRVRMVTANYFSLILRLDWHEGERHFARHLIDYDPSSNNGNWQWNSGVGLDNSGYLRIFNPFKQSADYDSDCVYIKRWVPELASVPPADIHKWETRADRHKVGYPAPVVDFASRRASASEWYRVR